MALLRSAATGGVRAHLTALATLLLAVALIVAGVTVCLLLRSSLQHTTDAATAARADTVATTIRTESVRGLDPESIAPSGNVDAVQVLGADGRVLIGTRDIGAATAAPAVEPGDRRSVSDLHLVGGDGPYRATVVGVQTPTGPVRVIAATVQRHVDEVVVTVAETLAVVFPVILVLFAISAYLVSSRTLAPVGRIRAQLADIAGSDLSRRVSVPARHDEIAALAATMNEMLGRIEAAKLAQTRFVGDASHELRSPLTTIVGVLDMARTRHEPIDAATTAELLLPEALRLQRLVDDLLLLARADERGLSVRAVDVDVDDLVLDEVARLRQSNRVEVTARVRPMRIRGDADAFARALRNLTDNAVRHAVSRIGIDMTVQARRACITVGDDGPGIPAAHRARVLDRFVRLDADRGRTRGGTGLGLAIVGEIVAAHGGELSLGRSPLGGLEARITVPAADLDEA